ncbi:thiamine phosphate synthase [bacterium]|nr:thiamine phosphate synthase [bacterium]
MTRTAARIERARRLADVDLYVVSGQDDSAGRTSLDVLRAVLAAGVRMVQLREKSMPMRALYELGRAFREETAQSGCLLIVNDHVDLALAIGADGVHLGQDDLPTAAARAIAPDLLIGRSTHSVEQAVAAEREGADYVNIGPIYPTLTKKGHSTFFGPAIVGDVLRHVGIPVTCMGGINAGNIDDVLDAGARIVAVVTAVTSAPDITEAARNLRRIMLGGFD